jgi:transcriptional regulator
MVKSYNVRVHELAELFLSDEKDLATQHNAHELALAIQETIEDWIEEKQIEISRREIDATVVTR